MPQSLSAGQLLADRYRLDDLLAESGEGRFWRAHDLVLDRDVAVHLVARDDERAGILLDAARLAAPMAERRLLRVLDADQLDTCCYVVNEWGRGQSLDLVLGAEGPLPPRRAAWIVAEVADSIAQAHASGLTHGRLVPENVLIDQHGQVRIIGFGVDAALHGLPPGRRSADTTDLVALLYAALTGKWAGVSSSVLPPAPMDGGAVLRPRRVRAGIPRTLDALCDEGLNPVGQSRGGGRATPVPVTARSVRDLLRAYVGDPGPAAAGVAVPLTPAFAAPPSPSTLPPAPAHGAAVQGEPEGAPDDAAEVAPAASAGKVEETDTEQPAVRDEAATEAGMPLFHDHTDEVEWLRTRSEPPTPPPAFEQPPERPLFAPDPPQGEPHRRPRVAQEAAGAAYWPWDTSSGGQHTDSSAALSTGSGTWRGVADDTADGTGSHVPGRSWFRLAMLVALAAVVLVAAVIAYQLGLGSGDEPSSTPSESPSETAEPTPLAGLTADDFDPQGSPPREENPDLVPLVLDGDDTTSWRTATYEQNFGPAGLKTGVGLVLDLGEPTEVREVSVATLGGPTSVSAYVTAEPPTGVAGLTPVGSASGSGSLDVAVDEAVSGRYVLVWLTSLPQVDGGFRGTVSEVQVLG